MTATKTKVIRSELRLDLVGGYIEVKAPESVDIEKLTKAIQTHAVLDQHNLRLGLRDEGFDVDSIKLHWADALDNVEVEVEKSEVVDKD